MIKKKKSNSVNSDNGIKKYWNYIKKFWDYAWNGDSLGSYLATLVLSFIIIKYIFFPSIGFVLNNDYPIVAIVSGSMEHKIVANQVCDKRILDVKSKKLDGQEWWDLCGSYYSKFNLTQDDFKDFDYPNGLNIGDVMVLYGKDVKDIEVGEILVFVPDDKQFFAQKGPVIHRVIQKWQDEDGEYHFRTKGDHNRESFANFEDDIHQDDVIAVAVFRIPFIGYAKLALYNAYVGVTSLF